MHSYTMHGLMIASELELPELWPAAPAGPADASFDVEIRFGRTPVELAAGCLIAEDYQVAAREILLSVPRVGRFWISGGASIVIETFPGADRDLVRIFLLGSAMAAILHQRDTIPLHASCVIRNGRCFAFLGDSGAGKSTLAAMLAARDGQLISDDVLALRPMQGDQFLVEPSAPLLKLWPQSIGVSGIEIANATFDSAEYKKLRIVRPEAFLRSATKIDRFYRLAWLVPGHAPCEIRTVPPIEALATMRKNVYRSALISALGREQTFLRSTAALLRGAPMFVFARPLDLDSAPRHLATLVAHMDSH